jgi:tetratricopeptide (TPR) repeat protein
MTRTAGRLLGALLVLVPGLVSAQSPRFEVETANYHIISGVSRDHAVGLGERLEAYLAVYNRRFRYPLDELTEKLRVRVFDTESEYDAYLIGLAGETRDGFVYLHYADPTRNELAGYQRDDGTLTQSLIHQSFVQYFRAFIPEPPLWLREGFAVSYEAIQYDPTFATARYRENQAWLETLKAMVNGQSERPLIPLDRMLSFDMDEAREQIDSFYPLAWGMVNFMENAEDPEINRLLWDSLSALDADNSLQENIDAVYAEAVRWTDQEALTAQFVAYVEQRRSFRDWVTEGVARYNDNDIAAAERAFIQAINLRSENYVPYYYLGLINYERTNYALADFYYQEALNLGAEPGVTLYALGVNAYADEEFTEAGRFFERALETDARYRERIEEMMARMGTEAR